MKNQKKFYKIAETWRKKGDIAFKKQNYLDASNYFFYAGEAYEKCKNNIFSAECYKKSFISNINSNEIMKDLPVEQYLGEMENILKKEKEYKLLENNFNKIETSLKAYGYNDLSTKYYLKKMLYRKKIFFKNKQYIKWLNYNIWQYTSNYGESFLRWFISILLITFINSILYYGRTPYKFIEVITIENGKFPLNNFIDHYFFSLITLAPWDWKYLIPVNIFGHIFIITKLLVGYIIFGLLINLITRKFVRK
jgi:hypothetical protein